MFLPVAPADPFTTADGSLAGHRSTDSLKIRALLRVGTSRAETDRPALGITIPQSIVGRADRVRIGDADHKKSLAMPLATSYVLATDAAAALASLPVST